MLSYTLIIFKSQEFVNYFIQDLLRTFVLVKLTTSKFLKCIVSKGIR